MKIRKCHKGKKIKFKRLLNLVFQAMAWKLPGNPQVSKFDLNLHAFFCST